MRLGEQRERYSSPGTQNMFWEHRTFHLGQLRLPAERSFKDQAGGKGGGGGGDEGGEEGGEFSGDPHGVESGDRQSG